MSFSYVLKEGFSGFRRTRLASVTSVTALVIAVLLSGLMARFGYNAFQVVQALKESIDVEVFLLDISEERRQRITSDLLEYPSIVDVNYISKEDAVEIFRQEFGAEGESLADLHFLPASIRLHFLPDATAADIRQVITEIETFQGVDEVVFNQQLLETLESRLEELGVLRSFSRPRVSNDNPYSESLFRTVKYRPDYPRKPFSSKDQACQWVAAFVAWYNHQHRHSGIKFVTPQQRHGGQAVEICRHRAVVYEQARGRNPRRWSRSTRCWRQPEVVWINQPSDELHEPRQLPLMQAA